MTGSDDLAATVLRNMLLGKWAAEKLGMSGCAADDYARSLAEGTFGPGPCDVFDKLRTDFAGAGVAMPDGEILNMMTELTVKAGNQLSTRSGGLADAAAVALKRNLAQR